MANPFVAEIRIFGFNFAPKGWAMCNGQLMPISQNTALFSLLGTFYGGDGKSTFALPDLQGAAPVHQGQGPGLSEYFLGQTGGSETITLLESEIPVHSHNLMAANSASISQSPAGQLPAGGIGGVAMYREPGATDASLAAEAAAVTGGSLPHNNLQPLLTFNFCIAMQGVFPPRS
jgi:microcystin-dependent protein